MTFDVAAGYNLNVTSFSFYRRNGGSSGYTNWSLAINGITVGSGTVTSTFAQEAANVANSVTGLTGTVTVVLTLSGGTHGPTNVFRLDDFTLNGYIMELPMEVAGRGSANTNQYRYGFNTQERSTEIHENSYTAQFWEYDARLGRRWNLDPKSTLGVSDYSALNNNPINIVDFFGDKPTPKEAAAMTAHVYGDKTDNILQGGWKVSTRKFRGVQLDNPDNGLKSKVYERQLKNGKTEYVYATAGTEGLFDPDAKADVVQPFGASRQYSQSISNAKKINDELKKSNSELTFTGHSLGGGEAAANAYATGRNAITFNAAGVSTLTMDKNKFSKVEAYILYTDPLNLMQNNNFILFSLLMPDVDGKKRYLFPKDFSSVYNGHSMDNMLKCFEINPSFYTIPKPAPTPSNYDPNIIKSVTDVKREAGRWINWSPF